MSPKSDKNLSAFEGFTAVDATIAETIDAH